MDDGRNGENCKLEGNKYCPGDEDILPLLQDDGIPCFQAILQSFHSCDVQRCSTKSRSDQLVQLARLRERGVEAFRKKIAKGWYNDNTETRGNDEECVDRQRSVEKRFTACPWTTRIVSLSSENRCEVSCPCLYHDHYSAQSVGYTSHKASTCRSTCHWPCTEQEGNLQRNQCYEMIEERIDWMSLTKSKVRHNMIFWTK